MRRYVPYPFLYVVIYLTHSGFLVLSITTLTPILSMREENIWANISFATSWASSVSHSTPTALLAWKQEFYFLLCTRDIWSHITLGVHEQQELQYLVSVFFSSYSGTTRNVVAYEQY